MAATAIRMPAPNAPKNVSKISLSEKLCLVLELGGRFSATGGFGVVVTGAAAPDVFVGAAVAGVIIPDVFVDVAVAGGTVPVVFVMATVAAVSAPVVFVVATVAGVAAALVFVGVAVAGVAAPLVLVGANVAGFTVPDVFVDSAVAGFTAPDESVDAAVAGFAVPDVFVDASVAIDPAPDVDDVGAAVDGDTISFVFVDAAAAGGFWAGLIAVTIKFASLIDLHRLSRGANSVEFNSKKTFVAFASQGFGDGAGVMISIGFVVHLQTSLASFKILSHCTLGMDSFSASGGDST